MSLGLLSVLTLIASQAPVATSTSAPRVELITIGPGSYLYSYWGHAALRVIDPRDGSDSAYNFGGIDLQGGVLGMMRGYVRGYMFHTRFSELLTQYSGEDRTITRRALALSEAEATHVADALAKAGSAERSYYAYHHFGDNCSTRIADALDEAAGGALKRAFSAGAAGSHRARVLRPVRSHPWLYLLLDLSYGPAVDRPLSAWETGFLVDGFAELMDRPSLRGRPLAEGDFDLYRSLSQDPDERWAWPWILGYTLLFFPLALLAAFFPRAAALTVGLLFGAMGALLGGLWAISSYDFFAGNWNLLVFPPAHLGLAALSALRWSRAQRWIRAYLFGHALLLLALLLAAPLLDQVLAHFVVAALPATLVLAWRVRRG